MRTIRSILSISVLSLLAASFAPAQAQAVKIGVFDPQRISENTQMGKKVQDELSAFRDRKQGEIDAKEQSIASLQQELSEKALSLSADKRTQMEKDIQLQLLDLQSAREGATRELQLEIAAAQQTFEEKLFRAVEAFGRDEGFELLLQRDLVAWSSAAVDVTTAIADRFNTMFPVSE